MTITDETRKLIVTSYLKGNSKKQIASMFNVKYHTICAIIKVYEKENRYEQKLKGGVRKRSLEENHIQAIRSWIDENCAMTLKAIKMKLQECYNIDICLKTVDRYISSFSYTIKQISLIPQRRNDEKAIQSRYNYAVEFFEIISKISESHIIFLDEVGFNVSMRTKKGRSLIGTAAVQVVPGLRMRNISVCAAMNRDGVVYYASQTQAFKSISFLEFLKELFVKLEAMGLKNAFVIMDNVPFHKHKIVREDFEQSSHTLLFLPPYSPFLNPIENMFSKWKHLIRVGQPKNESELFVLIETSCSKITPEDCSGFYRNIFSFLPKCLNKIPIIDG